MTAVLYSPAAVDDLDRLADFLRERLPTESQKTASLILDAISTLERHPLIGRPIEHGLRELVISRGESGYICLYQFFEQPDEILILRIRHQREAGF